MKNICKLKIKLITWIGTLIMSIMLHPHIVSAQAIAYEKSAKAAVMNDNHFIAANIEDIKSVLFLSQQAKDRATDEGVRDFIQDIVPDQTALLYSMEQLASAGTGSAGKEVADDQDIVKKTAEINNKLSTVSGSDFDTLWVSNMLNFQRAKYEELLQVKVTATNPQLKMAVTEAIPIVRKEVTQLKSMQQRIVKMLLQQQKEAAAAAKKKKKA
jgi:hypothetical protein